jgi:hypothetical protein
MDPTTGFLITDYETNATFTVARMSALVVPEGENTSLRIDYQTGSLYSDWDDGYGGFMECSTERNCTPPSQFDWGLVVDRSMPWQIMWILAGAAVLVVVVGAFLIFWGSAPRISFRRGMRPLVSLKEIPFV